MGRPKGITQKRRDIKYWLPKEVSLKENQFSNYNKTTKLIFIDSIYGEFISCFHNIQRAGSSNHPKRRKEKTKNTCLIKYGTENVSLVKEIRTRAQNTMQQKYGVKHALLSAQFIEKSKNTTLNRYGVENGMFSKEIKEKLRKSVINKYGTDNPMKVAEIKQILKNTMKEKYGVENAMQSPEIQQTWLNNTKNGSKSELEIKQYVESLGFNPIKKFIGGKTPREIDIFIPEKNIGIEYNGCLWHSEWNKSRKNPRQYHLEKFKLAKNNNIKLMQFFDFEWEGRKEQVKSFLKAQLQKNNRTIYARKTQIKEINYLETKDFLQNYHILGSCSFKKAYGLYFKEELLSLITINNHHYIKNNEIILTRYVVKNDVTVIGGLQKLTKHAIKTHGELFTWIDLRWSNGENWLKMGWKFIHQLPPDYFYFKAKTGEIISKQSRKKSNVNTPIDMTEHEHALNDGLYRVYDCGKIKLKYS